MADSTDQAVTDVIQQVFVEYGSRIKIDGSSKILVSDANVAHAIYKATEPVRTPYGPHITIAKRGKPGEDPAAVEGVATYKEVEQLSMDYYTNAVFAVGGEDPKEIMQIMKFMLYALQPKGISITISVKQESGAKAGDDQVVVSLEDKMKYQSKGRIEKLSDVLEYAGFERGKIRAFDKTTEVGGKKQEADVVLAMKWDQLTG